VTQVGSTTRVAVAATATATALVVGVVGIVLVVDDRRSGSTVTSSSPSGAAPSATHSTPMPTSTVPRPAPLLLPNMRSLSASDLQIEVVGPTRRLRFAASLTNVGLGLLFLLPRGRGGCPSSQHEAVQVLHRDANRDGKFQRTHDREASRRLTRLHASSSRSQALAGRPAGPDHRDRRDRQCNLSGISRRRHENSRSELECLSLIPC
jgi:hypothetical protein